MDKFTGVFIGGVEILTHEDVVKYLSKHLDATPIQILHTCAPPVPILTLYPINLN